MSIKRIVGWSLIGLTFPLWLAGCLFCTVYEFCLDCVFEAVYWMDEGDFLERR